MKRLSSSIIFSTLNVLNALKEFWILFFFNAMSHDKTYNSQLQCLYNFKCSIQELLKESRNKFKKKGPNSLRNPMCFTDPIDLIRS